MRIAVLMTCYNRCETTLKCLRMLFAQKCDEAALEVFLVDDSSPDRTGERVKAEFPMVNVISGTGSLYWSRGMNLAWQSAGMDHDAFLWLNDDVELKDGALAGLLADAYATEWKGVIVGSFLDGDSRMMYGVREKLIWVEPRGVPRSTAGDISGNCVLVPRMVCERIGIISADYSHAYGDFDYSARLRRAGIPYYLASEVCGRCDDAKPDRALESKSLFERVKYLFMPGGRNWRDAVLYRWRYYGLWRTLLTAIHVPYLVIKGRRGPADIGERHVHGASETGGLA